MQSAEMDSCLFPAFLPSHLQHRADTEAGLGGCPLAAIEVSSRTGVTPPEIRGARQTKPTDLTAASWEGLRRKRAHVHACECSHMCACVCTHSRTRTHTRTHTQALRENGQGSLGEQ